MGKNLQCVSPPWVPGKILLSEMETYLLKSICRGEIWIEEAGGAGMRHTVSPWAVGYLCCESVPALGCAEQKHNGLALLEQLIVAASLFQDLHRDILLRPFLKMVVAQSILGIRMSRLVWNTLAKSLREARQPVLKTRPQMGISVMGHCWPTDAKCNLFMYAGDYWNLLQNWAGLSISLGAVKYKTNKGWFILEKDALDDIGSLLRKHRVCASCQNAQLYFFKSSIEVQGKSW